MISAKLIFGIIALAVIAAVWLRIQWGRSRNQNESKKIIADLKSGKHVIESYADAFSIMIVAKPLSGEINRETMKHYLHSLTDKKILDKYTVQYGDMNENNKGIIIGEGFVKDIVHDRQIDVHYPCWLYIDVNEEGKEVSFRSTFPENKDHHYLLEDLSQEIFNQCMKS
jgi:hypothetical protein